MNIFKTILHNYNIKVMYDTNFICTYQLIDDIDESDTLYKIQFLQACCLDEWEDKCVNEICKLIYDKMSGCERGLTILKNCNKWSPFPITSDDLSMSAIILCCFELFHLTHNCMIDLLTTNEITDKSYNKMMATLDS